MSALFLFPKSKKKKLYSTLPRIFGIGFTKTVQFASLLGLGRHGTLNLLIKRTNKHDVMRRLALLASLNDVVIMDKLQDSISKRLLFYNTVANARGLRHSYNLPVNGQRTHSNCETVKRMYYAKLRRVQEDVLVFSLEKGGSKAIRI